MRDVDRGGSCRIGRGRLRWRGVAVDHFGPFIGASGLAAQGFAGGSGPAWFETPLAAPHHEGRDCLMVRSRVSARLEPCRPLLDRNCARICDRAAARLNSRHDRRRRLRFPPSAPLCPSGYDPAAALAGGARPARRDLHRGAGAGIRRSRHSLRRHRRPLGADQSRAADRLQPDAAAGTGLCGGAARAQHRRTGRAAVPHRRACRTRFRSCSSPRS